MFSKIMVALDESPESSRALSLAIELAKAVRAQLAVITVIEPLPLYFSFGVSSILATRWVEDRTARSAALEADASRRIKEAGLLPDATVIDGEEVASILQAIKRHGSDLLVLGLQHHLLFMGNTAHDLAEHAPCALLSVR